MYYCMRMPSVGRYGRCAVAHRPVHLAHVPHVRPVRVDVRLRPRVRRHAVRPIANPLPLAEVQCGPVKHVTVPHREAVRDAHGQPADKHARQMLRGPEVVVVQMLRGQHARHEAGVVRVQKRGKDDLLAACVKVRPQCVDLGPDGARTGGAAVQRHPVDAVRLGVDNRAQKLLQIEAEYHQVQYQRVAQHEQMDVARLLICAPQPTKDASTNARNVYLATFLLTSAYASGQLASMHLRMQQYRSRRLAIMSMKMAKSQSIRCKNCVALAMMVKPNMNSSFISSELCSVFGYGTCFGNGVYMALPSSSPLLSGLLLRCCAPAVPLAASAWDPA
uniref:Uncharacterized protein n=1 Tax=Anopheles quadriannulatus TaxID=34691 RepID=A0A182XT72_ANOQN